MVLLGRIELAPASPQALKNKGIFSATVGLVMPDRNSRGKPTTPIYTRPPSLALLCFCTRGRQHDQTYTYRGSAGTVGLFQAGDGRQSGRYTKLADGLSPPTYL